MKKSDDKILCLQDSSQAEQGPVEFFLQNANWNGAFPALVSRSHTSAVPRNKQCIADPLPESVLVSLSAAG